MFLPSQDQPFLESFLLLYMMDLSVFPSAYPGFITDNAITCKSGILSRLELADEIMVDKGFTLSNTHLEPRGIKLVAPPFQQKCGFSAAEISTTKIIANLWIVV